MAVLGQEDATVVAESAAAIVGRLDQRMAELTASIQQIVVTEIAELRGDTQLVQLLRDSIVVSLVSSSGVTSTRSDRPGSGHRRCPGRLRVNPPVGRWVGRSPGSRPCWPGRSRSPSGRPIRRSAAASAAGVAVAESCGDIGERAVEPDVDTRPIAATVARARADNRCCRDVFVDAGGAATAAIVPYPACRSAIAPE